MSSRWFAKYRISWKISSYPIIGAHQKYMGPALQWSWKIGAYTDSIWNYLHFDKLGDMTFSAEERWQGDNGCSKIGAYWKIGSYDDVRFEYRRMSLFPRKYHIVEDLKNLAKSNPAHVRKPEEFLVKHEHPMNACHIQSTQEATCSWKPITASDIILYRSQFVVSVVWRYCLTSL